MPSPLTASPSPLSPVPSPSQSPTERRNDVLGLDKRVSDQEFTGCSVLIGLVVALVAWIVRLFTLQLLSGTRKGPRTVDVTPGVAKVGG